MDEDVIALIGFFLVPIVALIVLYFTRRLKTQERLRAIEKGVNIPFEPADPRERAARTRRWGIVLVAAGLGVIIFSGVMAAVIRDRNPLIGAGFAAIPILIGMGLLLEYRLRSKELATGGQNV